VFEEEIKDEKWRIAIDEKIASIKKNNTWKLVPISKEKKLIGVKWIYKEKKNAKREKKRYKAGLEEKSYSQKQGINYNEVFALLNTIKGKLQEIKDMQA
jgi:hypothetical protein